MDDINLIRPKKLTKKLGIAMSTLYEWQKRPDFPAKIHIGPNAVAFREKDVQEWLEARAESKAKTAQ